VTVVVIAKLKECWLPMHGPGKVGIVTPYRILPQPILMIVCRRQQDMRFGNINGCGTKECGDIQQLVKDIQSVLQSGLEGTRIHDFVHLSMQTRSPAIMLMMMMILLML
jgi:hypothetical protein